MIKLVSRAVQRHPWVILCTTLVMTIFFSFLLPSIEMKTEIEDFMPDDELVKASFRCLRYFGGAKEMVLVRVEREGGGSILSPRIVREMHLVESEIRKFSEVNQSIGFSTFINQACLMEFGKDLSRCDDEEIDTAMADLLKEWNQSIVLLSSRGEKDDLEIENCRISYNETHLKIMMKVHGLSRLRTIMRKMRTNCFEWYIDFRNKILPSKELDIDYRISARIEPRYEFWELGRGVFKNVRKLLSHARNREFGDFRKDVYLWIGLPNQSFSYPVRLENANLDIDGNEITISIPRDELSRFGIGLRIYSLYLPAKLSDFRIGTRCYRGLFYTPWGRLAVNSSFLIDKMRRMNERPIIGKIQDKILEEFIGMRWEDIERALEEAKGIYELPRSFSLKDVEGFWRKIDEVEEKNKILFLKPPLFDELRNDILGLISEDRRSSLIVVWLDRPEGYKEDLELNGKILKGLKRLDERCRHIKIDATGDGIVTLHVHEATWRARKIIEPLIFLIILLILLVSFRRFSYIILPMVSLVVSLIWTFGTMVLFGIAFNTIMVAVIPLLLGLGVDYSVHLLHTYRKGIMEGKKAGDAIAIAVEEVGRGLFLAMLTTAIAFLSFLSAVVPPVRNFGIVLAIGIFYTFLHTITFQASIRYLLDRGKEFGSSANKRNLLMERLMMGFSKGLLKHGRYIILSIALVSVLMLWGAGHNRISFDFKDLLPKDDPAVELFDKISSDFPHAGHDRERILIEGDVASVETLKGIRDTHENIDDDLFVARRVDGTTKVYSIYTLIRQAVKLNSSLMREFNMDADLIPKTDEDVRRLFDYLYDSEIYGGQTRTLLYREGRDYRATVIQVEVDPMISRRGDFSENLRILSRELNQDISYYGDANAIATGPLLITLSITDSLTKSQISSTMLSFILAFIVLVIVYRRFGLSFFAMLPVTLSMVWILGTMYFIGISLNVLTITVTSLTIGIGIDYAIHTIERYRISLSRVKDARKAMMETLSHTGVALLISALSTAMGFSVLVFAPTPPQAQFGMMIAMTICYSLLITLTLLPLALIRLKLSGGD